MITRKLILLAGLAGMFALSGCALFQSAPKPQKGGSATVTRPSATAPASVTITQPENPTGSSKQETKEQEATTYIFPQATEVVTETKQVDGSSIVVTEKIPAGTKKIVTSSRDVKQEIGAAQKDDSREITAKLASFKPVQYVGIALLLVAAAMFHPLVRGAIGGGKEIQMATAGIGVALIFGPSLFVGNERLILLGGLAALLITYGLSRLAYYKGKHDVVVSKS
jgi:hypothetical protein